MVDRKGRVFGLINVFDLAVVVIMIALVAGVAYRLAFMGPGAERGAEQRPVRVTLLVEDVRQPTVDTIRVGQVVRDHDNNAVFGTIVAMHVRPAERTVATADGRLVSAQVPEMFDIILELDGTASVSRDAIVIARKETRIGTQVRLRTQTLFVLTVVTGIALR
ncbi:MAG TPA: hypothetical protein DCM14_06145 [Clostridiales bacterium UBA8153]|nr:hypothetical protein [Clostridiales bacterium UBA8153]